MSNLLIRQIRSAIQASDHEKARMLLKDALKNPTAEIFFLASQAALNDQQRETFLEKALDLDPFYKPTAEASDPSKGKPLGSSVESEYFPSSQAPPKQTPWETPLFIQNIYKLIKKYGVFLLFGIIQLFSYMLIVDEVDFKMVDLDYNFIPLIIYTFC